MKLFVPLFFIPFILLTGCSSNMLQKQDEIKPSLSCPDLFSELLVKNKEEVNSKVNAAFNHYFYGNDSTQRLYYPVGNDMAYLMDILHNDIRSEGMSYGMMIAVQLDKKEEFNRLWKWAKTYMQHKSGPGKNFFAWQMRADGKIIDSTSASDGEEWIVMSLLLAAQRWGNGEGIYNYKAEAQVILDAMFNKESEAENNGSYTNMFNKNEKMVVFVPEPQADDFTDPSYHLPHFYELWGKWADKDNQFWKEAAAVSREYFKKAVHPKTGLAPDYSKFDGTPYNPWGGGNDNFQYDAFRVAMNVAVDYSWFLKNSTKGEWAITQSNRLLNFFYSQGIKTYGNLWALDGKKIQNDHSGGLVAMNAVAALAATSEHRKEFVEELWNLEMPSGLYRYYDGVLYMLGLLQVSGNFSADFK